MVKKKLGGKQRYKASGKTTQGEVKDSKQQQDKAQPGPRPPKHVQRKVTRKVQFLQRVEASKQAALKQKDAGVKKKGGQQNKRKQQQQFNLGSLAGTLEELAAQGSSGPDRQKVLQLTSVKHEAGRSQVTKREINRLQQVVQLPAFQANPIDTITRHLQATLPPPKSTAASAAAAAARSSGKKQRRKAKGKQESAMET